MQSCASFDEQKGEWICKCGEPAPYLHFAPLDRTTGEPILYRGLKLAICKTSECDFRAPWEDRAQTKKESRTHDSEDFSGSTHTPPYTKFENVNARGNNNQTGIFNWIYNCSTLVSPEPVVPFETYHNHSERIVINANIQPQYPISNPLGDILGLIIIVGLFLNYRRFGRER